MRCIPLPFGVSLDGQFFGEYIARIFGLENLDEESLHEPIAGASLPVVRRIKLV
jgi:hypothetical protein